MRHGSLFSGIGGFDLAAQWMGWENVFQVEIDPFCQRVLEKNFPGVKRYGDIKQFDGTQYRGAVDIISGGFPCQPFSVAGKRKGKDDDRFLWPEMLRIIGEVKPFFIVGENVTGIIGLALDQVLTEVEAQGYHTETFIIPACGVNAPHRRDRIWIVAYRAGERCGEARAGSSGQKERAHGDGGEWSITNPESMGWRNWVAANKRQAKGEINASANEACLCDPTDPNSQGLSERQSVAGMDSGTHGRHAGQVPTVHSGRLTQPPVCRRNDGIPNRLDRIKALGNSVVPQVVFEIFKAIQTVIDNDPTRTKA